MATDLASLNLGQIVTESEFFNDTAEERAIVAQVQAEGYGFYRLKKLKSGAFVEATKVSEIAEDNFEVIAWDRACVDADPEFVYLYVHLVPIAV